MSSELSELPELPESEADEEVLGTPSFEVLVPQRPGDHEWFLLHGAAEVYGEADWDDDNPNRLLVTATDGSRWYDRRCAARRQHQRGA